MSRGSDIRSLVPPFIIGIVLGIVAKFTDGRDFLYYFPLFADVMGRFGIWVWVAALIAIRSKNPLLAAIRSFAFFIGMLLAYYGYTVLYIKKSLCKFHFFFTFYNFLYRMVLNSFYCSGLGFQDCQR